LQAVKLIKGDDTMGLLEGLLVLSIFAVVWSDPLVKSVALGLAMVCVIMLFGDTGQTVIMSILLLLMLVIVAGAIYSGGIDDAKAGESSGGLCLMVVLFLCSPLPIIIYIGGLSTDTTSILLFVIPILFFLVCLTAYIIGFKEGNRNSPDHS